MEGLTQSIQSKKAEKALFKRNMFYKGIELVGFKNTGSCVKT